MKTTKQRFTALICYLVTMPALLAACGLGGTPSGQLTATPVQFTTATPAPPTAPATAPVAATPIPTTAPATAPVVVTPAPTAPPAPPAPTQPDVGAEPGYLDDRSTAETVILSYYNAINRNEYARAYSYWESQAAGTPDGPPPFAEFAQGYADTAAVQVQLGPIGEGAAAGQRYFTVPVVLTAQSTSGAGQRFAGCYTLHLADPQLQAEPPFRPLGIQSAGIREATGDTDATALLNQECP